MRQAACAIKPFQRRCKSATGRSPGTRSASPTSECDGASTSRSAMGHDVQGWILWNNSRVPANFVARPPLRGGPRRYREKSRYSPGENAAGGAFACRGVCGLYRTGRSRGQHRDKARCPDHRFGKRRAPGVECWVVAFRFGPIRVLSQFAAWLGRRCHRTRNLNRAYFYRGLGLG